MNKNFFLNNPGEVALNNILFDIHNDYVLEDFYADYRKRNLIITLQPVDKLATERLRFEIYDFHSLLVSQKDNAYPSADDRGIDTIGYLIPEADTSENGFLLEDMIEGERHLIFLFESRWFIRFGARSAMLSQQSSR